MSYELHIARHPRWVHATATGDRVPENLVRFMREAYAACVEAGAARLLLDMRLEGSSLDLSKVFAVISDRAPDGMKLARIAYLDAAPDGKEMFAETVARNRGVNVKLFRDPEAAARWLDEEEAP